MSKVERLRSSHGLLGSCKPEKLPSQVTLSSAWEELSMDFDQV